MIQWENLEDVVLSGSDDNMEDDDSNMDAEDESDEKVEKELPYFKPNRIFEVLIAENGSSGAAEGDRDDEDDMELKLNVEELEGKSNLMYNKQFIKCGHEAQKLDGAEEMVCSFAQRPEVERCRLVSAVLFVKTSPEGEMNHRITGKSLEETTRHDWRKKWRAQKIDRA